MPLDDQPITNAKTPKIRLVDLTRRLDPATEKRRCQIRTHYGEAKGTSGYSTDMDLMSHLGTHLEFPRHWKEHLKDGTQLSVTQFMGRGVLLDLEDIAAGADITYGDLERANRGRVRRGDTVLLNSPHRCEPFSDVPDDPRPNLSIESARWCVDKRIQCVGFGDAVAIENEARVEGCNAMHQQLLTRDILMLEVVENLDELRQGVFFMTYTPLKIIGLDSCPVRVVAVEGLAEFS